MKIQPYSLHFEADELAMSLASHATQSLIDEARLSPKPGLVDSRGSGAHQDLTLELMERSAHSLTPAFQQLAIASWQRSVDIALRQEIGRIGRDGERSMMLATNGVNTHRGAIWALGLLVSAAAIQGAMRDLHATVTLAAQIAKLPDHASPKIFSKGLRATQRYRVPGAREEAQLGFPHVMTLALPQLWLSREQGASEQEARIDALMAIMTSLSDTCVLSRGGLSSLKTMQQGAAEVLTRGGYRMPKGRAALAMLESRMLADRVSPGGAADLLAAALFLDRVYPR
ncbi:triphosphoribosyl-dephospho-CoA synthase [Salmonella enterica]|uniref:2-(5''-triphosphoribosyl)-3'-dephosphocoenzyme-A synthase n=4 Tax=Salmonella enterica TaxID=28901 RepID=A0A743TW61_SALER|nr:triphosphoribosyl-dephospho-CoA synthase [Salmonella enterica]EBR7996634.1 triphosphoribosyl-dephospho-CoA synthase MdcB [Salmonella enterica subsp. enterica serovar Panama]EBS4088641.1 triphosphoribosyl-dephospho-CoA synthase MdcB [Salmonella enterica subsp. enterica serovar Newport]EBV1274909.1 triphosphoribosyl-dephospho-CoA synthase MdcB [Salmonella enterica subsp. enterica serovar Oranienburg]EBW8395121.1 triphosphoribosyl-dephospho-CoA synthase [Salmonella enterica subsp. enterica sero